MGMLGKLFKLPIDGYVELTKRLCKITRKGKPELGMALLEDYYVRNKLPIDSRYNEWMAHFRALRLLINHKAGFRINPETNADYLFIKNCIDRDAEFPRIRVIQRMNYLNEFEELILT